MHSQRLRLFFALPCPAESAQGIAQWRDNLAIDGAAVAPGNLHVTLAFLGMQAVERLPELISLAEKIEAPPFTLEFDRMGLWKDGLLHLASSRPPTTLLDIARRLQHELQARAFALEQHKYQPHLTLARNCQRATTQIPPVFAWEVRTFNLFASEPHPGGVSYRALAGWNLRQPD